MIRLSIFAMLSILFTLPRQSNAQNEQGYGLIYNPSKIADIPRVPEQLSGSKSVRNMEMRKDLSIPNLQIARQGHVESCVAWSTSYYAYAIQYAHQYKDDTYLRNGERLSEIMLSAMYPYIHLRPSCTAGLGIEEVADFIIKNGNVYYQDFPYTTCDAVIPPGLKPYFPIKDKQLVFDERDSPAKRIAEVRKAIGLYNKPVIVGMAIGDNFRHLKRDTEFYELPKQGAVRYHAMTVVGYDILKDAFKLVNSWGEDWCQSGYFWMKSNEFVAAAKCGLTLVLADTPERVVTQAQKTVELGGEFGFQYLDSSTGKFLQTRPRLTSNGIYELDKRDWPVGQLFQLLTNNTKSGQAMCVFSIDANNEINRHWPVSSESDAQFGMRTTDILPVKNFDMVIPGPTKALAIDEAGTDFLCVLFSDRSLMDDLPAILKQIGNTKGDIQTRIRAGLGSRLIAGNNVKYEPNAMRFSAKDARGGDTVCLVLKVESVVP